ncbi:PDGLE domain-containing protein [Streptomonospora salina]|uniref:Cobalt/nickel transport system permease protein n=1 Tax=Streptomonospora salina TaxID=104205 RepID=A0A841EAQ8_9ACTN|nr:PDGLE domain-containing protein [Streptomonospora salina]MBB5998143.1 cobalt/nickel transport system permease protein [Streptomonospora salina]
MRVATRTLVITGLTVALLLAGGLSYFASAEPDGLNRVAADLGFARAEQDHALGTGPLADYATTGITAPWLSSAIAGTVGVLAAFTVAWGLFLLVHPRRPRADASAEAGEKRPGHRG